MFTSPSETDRSRFPPYDLLSERVREVEEKTRRLEDVNAKMAATGQVFDEARHFAVLRDYLRRAGVELPPLNPYGRRLLTGLLDTCSTPTSRPSESITGASA